MLPTEELDALLQTERNNLQSVVSVELLLFTEGPALYERMGGNLMNVRRMLQVKADIELLAIIETLPVPQFVERFFDWRDALRQLVAKRVGEKFDSLFPASRYAQYKREFTIA